MKSGKILAVDDNKNVINALRILFQSNFEQVKTLLSPKTLISELKEFKPDIVLLDMNFSAGINSGNEGLFWLDEVKKYNPSLPVVLFTSYAEIDLAVEALKRGASDFVVKPWENAKLVATLKAAMKFAEPRKIKNQSNEESFWGSGKSITDLLSLVDKVAKTDANILITGENGTGKEQIAKEIHKRSSRSEKVMLTVDMGALTETLFESELFGHVKGAFTDARSERTGKFEAADGGTLFLDEIANLSYQSQVKLLTVLQSRRIVKVGSNTPIPVNIRLICATNRDLYKTVAAGEFREDLMYRINTIHIEVPPLRDRREDIIPLAEFFLDKYGAKYGKLEMKLSDQAKNKLLNYAFPGNVREMQHAVEKAVILSNGSELQASDFYMRESSMTQTSFENMNLEEAEKMLINKSLIKHGGNLTLAAAELGITRPTLYSKIKKYNL